MYTNDPAHETQPPEGFDMLYGALKHNLDTQFGIKIPADWEAAVLSGELDTPLEIIDGFY